MSTVKSAPEQKLCREAEDLFKQFSGEDLEVNAHELRDILNATFSKGKNTLSLVFKIGSDFWGVLLCETFSWAQHRPCVIMLL